MCGDPQVLLAKAALKVFQGSADLSKVLWLMWLQLVVPQKLRKAFAAQLPQLKGWSGLWKGRADDLLHVRRAVEENSMELFCIKFRGWNLWNIRNAGGRGRSIRHMKMVSAWIIRATRGRYWEKTAWKNFCCEIEIVISADFMTWNHQFSKKHDSLFLFCIWHYHCR